MMSVPSISSVAAQFVSTETVYQNSCCAFSLFSSNVMRALRVRVSRSISSMPREVWPNNRLLFSARMRMGEASSRVASARTCAALLDVMALVLIERAVAMGLGITVETTVALITTPGGAAVRVGNRLGNGVAGPD